MTPYSPTNLAAVIKENKQKKMAVGKIIESNPATVSVIPKLIADKTAPRTVTDPDQLQLNKSILEAIGLQLESNRNNNRNIMKLFPDIELCVQILVSSILSPKKMTDVELIYKLKKDFKFPPTVAAALVTELSSYVTDEYGLENKLPEIVREALFTSGSYSMAVIPESSVDELINKDIIASFSTESFKREVDSIISEIVDPVHLKKYDYHYPLPKEDEITAESLVRHLASSEFISVTDNTNLLKYAELKEEIRSDLIRKSHRRQTTASMEAVKDKIEYLDIFRQRQTSSATSNVTFLKTRDEARRKSVGKPMTVKWPASSVIPVTIPGNVTEHAGFLILQDADGKPLNMDASNDTSGGNRPNMFGDANSSVLTPAQIAYKNLIADTDAKIDAGQLFNMYKEIVENQIFSTIKGSLYGKSVEITNKNDIYYIMFMRAIADQKTSILFVPKELMVYFYFNLNDHGIGKSVLDNLSILTSMRAILLFARVMSQAKQAIDVTDVNITFDPRDPDPEKTISIIQDGALKLRQNFFPLGINNPVDLINWIQRAGLKFTYSNHPLLPETKIEFSNANITHTVPDPDLEETLRKQTFQALGMPPELVDNAFSPEFATNVVNNNILLSKRVLLNQQCLTRDLTKLVSLYIYNDQSLRERLRDLIEKNKDEVFATLSESMKSLYEKNNEAFFDAYLDELAANVEIELPKPENTNLTNLAAEYEEYKNGLLKIFETLLDAEVFSDDIAGEMSNHVNTVKNIYISQLLRQWCADNNYYPEALALVGASKEEASKLIESATAQITASLRNGALLLRTMSAIKDALTKDLNDVNGQAGTPQEASSVTSTSDTNETPNDETAPVDETGDDDMSGDDMLKL